MIATSFQLHVGRQLLDPVTKENAEQIMKFVEEVDR